MGRKNVILGVVIVLLLVAVLYTTVGSGWASEEGAGTTGTKQGKKEAEKDKEKEATPPQEEVIDADERTAQGAMKGVALEEKLAYFTQGEMAQLAKGRDPYGIQDDVKRVTAEIKAEYERYMAEQEKQEATKSEPVGSTGGEVTKGEDTGDQPGVPSGEEGDTTQLTREGLYPLVTKIAAEYGIDEAWVYAIIENESGYNQFAKGENTDESGKITSIDRGLMQINSKTSPWIAKKLGVPYKVDMEYDVRQNIEMGVYYLAYLKGISEDTDFIFTAYNRGATGANDYKQKTGTYETDYSKKVKTTVEGLGGG